LLDLKLLSFFCIFRLKHAEGDEEKAAPEGGKAGPERDEEKADEAKTTSV